MFDPRTVTESGAVVLNANALDLPLPDESVDLIITSPPYFALRSYRDGDEHYDGQIGSEPTPQDFLEALWAATAEMVRVLKPGGSIWVNLGDKYAGSGMGGNTSLANSKSYLEQRAEGYACTTTRTLAKPETTPAAKGESSGPSLAPTSTARKTTARSRTEREGGIPAKSLMGLPWRYAIGCIDHLGLILRAEVIWSKPNGLPESVTDRVRRSHEQWFHFTKQGRYFSAIDEVREAYNEASLSRYAYEFGHGPAASVAASPSVGDGTGHTATPNPLGKLPGSVWTIPSEPLIIPEAVQRHYDLPDHFAAFPQEWPRKIILGWSPSGICTACGEGRRPVVDVERLPHWKGGYTKGAGDNGGVTDGGHLKPRTNTINTITGYTCVCDSDGYRTAQGLPLPPTRPAVVLDPFGGTGTVAMVARALGRYGISVDLSQDYCRLAEWRIFQSGHADKTDLRTNREAQQELFA
jgi:hypothetical protein